MSGPAGERVLGAGRAVQLRLEAPNVEPTHARVRWDDFGIYVDDLSAEQGTFLNGERFEVGADLKDGDRIWLGPPGDAGSVRVAVHLPGHPRDFADEEPLAPAADESDKWGALDDDEQVMATDKAADKPAVAKARGTTGPIPETPGTPRSVASPGSVAPAMRPRAMAARPPVGRMLMVGGAALLLGIVGYALRSRSLAGGPSIVSLLPPKAEAGQTIQLGGSGFEPKPEGNLVTFGDKKADVIAASETQLSVVVPPGLPPDEKPQYKVKVQARGINSNTLYFHVFIGPRVGALEPDVAMPGDVVRATGEHLGSDAAISVGGLPAEIIEATETTLRFRVPSVTAPQGKAVPVSVNVGGNAARLISLSIGKLPLLSTVTPTRGVPGDRVTLAGRGFDPAPGGTSVTFNGRRALVLSAGERELVAVVPAAGSLSGASDTSIAVRVGSASSGSPLAFTVARPSLQVLLPRFFPEPGNDPETVVVSSDIGPFLRLHDKGDAPSTAERAVRVAAAMNKVMEQASRGELAIETREKPQPAVAVVGAAQPIVSAAPDDALAYEGRPGPRPLARYWTALLQDYVALFAQRQRPYRVLELSPRGHALLDLYAAAERRAGTGAGVPPVVVESLSPAQSSALAEMAMTVPAESQATSGAAVVGRWAGSFDETGNAPRAIEVRIAARGSTLSGSLTLGSGKVSGDLPLEGLEYRQGSLSFVTRLGTTTFHFLGKLDGRSITGAVQGKDGKPVGSFSLRWVG